MKVYMEKSGKFIFIFEISSHSPKRVFGWQTAELDRASVFEDDHDIKDVVFKDPHDKTNIVAELKVKVTRIVTLTERVL